MAAHLVVFRPGLWRQTAGDVEKSFALQLRKVPTKHLGLTNHGRMSVSLCTCSSVQYILVGYTVCMR